MADLTELLAPLAKAEREVQQVERRFGFLRRHPPAQPPDVTAPTPPDEGASQT